MAPGFLSTSAPIAPPHWRRRLLPLWQWSQQQWQRQRQTRLFRRLKAQRGWFIATLIYTSLLAWQEQWVLASTVGLAIAIAIFQIQQGYWHLPIANWRRYFDSRRHPLRMALIGGAIAMLWTFLALTGEMGTLGWLWQGGLWAGLALWLGAARRAPRRLQPQSMPFSPMSLEALTADLDHPSLIKRYAAVRRLARADIQARLTACPSPYPGVSVTNYLRDCLHLMAAQETSPQLQQAIAATLQALAPIPMGTETPPTPPQLGTGAVPLTFPPAIATASTSGEHPTPRPPAPRHHPSSSQVEPHQTAALSLASGSFQQDKLR